MEHINYVKIKVEIETNKRSINEEFDEIINASEFISEVVEDIEGE